MCSDHPGNGNHHGHNDSNGNHNGHNNPNNPWNCQSNTFVNSPFKQSPDDFYPTNIDELGIKNLQLFFQKLSESGSFAHKAHKELQRLNK